MKKNSFLYIPHEKEWIDTNNLLRQIAQEMWVSPDTVIVNCNPERSSRLVQVINHRLSYLNGNELLEQVDLRIPQPSMSQVWNPISRSYEMFDRYMKGWIAENIRKSSSYLFISSEMLAQQPYPKIRMMVSPYLDLSSVRIGALYKDVDCSLSLDYCVETFDKPPIFEWENTNNKLI